MEDYDYHGLVAQTWDLHRADAENWSDSVLDHTLFAEVGFTDIRALHEFTDNPALPEDRLFCLVGAKPA